MPPHDTHDATANTSAGAASAGSRLRVRANNSPEPNAISVHATGIAPSGNSMVGMLLLVTGAVVSIVTVTDCVPMPLICTDDLDNVHVGAGVTLGVIAQLKFTVPVNDPVGASANVKLAVCPALMVSEVGDPPKPKLVFFFDEAHLLFNEAPKELLEKVEQVVRLIRSKGVGVYFVTQNPVDVPDKVLAQLGNRVQHALRAFTPGDQKAVKAAADTFRSNPKLDTAQVITQLAKGEALVSFLEGGGAPSMVDRTADQSTAPRGGSRARFPCRRGQRRRYCRAQRLVRERHQQRR